jgi:hypothetical protein
MPRFLAQFLQPKRLAQLLLRGTVLGWHRLCLVELRSWFGGFGVGVNMFTILFTI